MNVTKQLKWTIFWGWLGFVVLILSADTVSNLLGKFGVISDSTVASLQRNVPEALFLFFVAFLFYAFRRAEKRP